MNKYEAKVSFIIDINKALMFLYIFRKAVFETIYHFEEHLSAD